VIEYRRSNLVVDRIVRESQEKRGSPLVMIWPGEVLGQGDNRPTSQPIGDMIDRRVPVAAVTAATS
jgi:hypothetical protein